MEILYCAECQTRVTGADLDRGRAFRSGDRILCATCAPRELAQVKPAPPAPRPDSSPRLRATASTRRAPAVAPAPRIPLLWVVLGVFGGILLLVVLLLSGGQDRRSPEATQPALPPIVHSAPSPARPAAEWTALDKRVQEATDHEDFQSALGALEGARRSDSESDWNRLIDRRVSELKTRIDALFQDLRNQVDKARREGIDASTLVSRVSRWRLPGYSLEEKAVTAPPPPAPPPTPAPPPGPAPSPPALVVYDDRLAPGWQDWSYSTQREYNAPLPSSEGKHFLSVVFERNGAGLYLHSTSPLDGSRYASIEFLCRAEGGPQMLILSVQDDQHQSLGTISFGKIGGHPPVGSWKRYEVPLSLLNAAGKKISGITIQAVGTVNRNPVYFDSIRLRPAP